MKRKITIVAICLCIISSMFIVDINRVWKNYKLPLFTYHFELDDCEFCNEGVYQGLFYQFDIGSYSELDNRIVQADIYVFGKRFISYMK